MSENGEIYTAGKTFTLPPELTAWTNSTSVVGMANYDRLGDLVVVVHLANYVPHSGDMIPPPT